MAVCAALLLAACSETPAPTAKKAAEPAVAPITGRQAFQMTYPQARSWAADCQPMRIRSFNLPEPKSADGKAGAWEILWVSAAKGRQRIYTWSAVESEGNLHKGVFAGLEDAWRGPQGQEKPFSVAALQIDTPEAYQTAVAKSAEYLKKPGEKPQVTFLCEFTPRFPDPAWRVMWGQSVSAAEWSVFVDASTGQYLGH
ncbi:MAG TPA: hypothetical protein VKX39_18935 [Bryobacteraceae bacterium]|jgi:hypothetical protein|nr:hypothetical protein [Bryobacteraceae bacterium]